jgi:hypothetical protein
MTPICWAYLGRVVELTHFHRHSGAAFRGRSEWLGTDAADVPVTSGSIVEQLDSSRRHWPEDLEKISREATLQWLRDDAERNPWELFVNLGAWDVGG